MAIQVCRGPPEYGEAIRRGIIPGVLQCNWFFYTGPTPELPVEFGSEDACLRYEIPEINKDYHWGERNCGRIE